MARLRPLLPPALLCLPALAHAHGVDDADRAVLEPTAGTQVLAFIGLGAKHLVTGHDHLLFLLGVIVFLHRLREVAIVGTLFALGHSVMLPVGVLTGTNVNPHLIDAIIGLSVVFEGLDVRNEAVAFTLRPNAGAEVKAVLRAGDPLLYRWEAGSAVPFEFHQQLDLLRVAAGKGNPSDGEAALTAIQGDIDALAALK